MSGAVLNESNCSKISSNTRPKNAATEEKMTALASIEIFLKIWLPFEFIPVKIDDSRHPPTYMRFFYHLSKQHKKLHCCIKSNGNRWFKQLTSYLDLDKMGPSATLIVQYLSDTPVSDG